MDSQDVRSAVHLQAPLRANTAFSVLSAVVLLLFPSQFVALAGLPAAFRPVILGCCLLAYGVWLLQNALQREIKLSNARIAVALDVTWVVLSVPVALLSPLTNGGRWLVATVAAAVSGFALLQWRGIRIVRDNPIEANHD